MLAVPVDGVNSDMQSVTYLSVYSLGFPAGSNQTSDAVGRGCWMRAPGGDGGTAYLAPISPHLSLSRLHCSPNYLASLCSTTPSLYKWIRVWTGRLQRCAFGAYARTTLPRRMARTAAKDVGMVCPHYSILPLPPALTSYHLPHPLLCHPSSPTPATPYLLLPPHFSTPLQVPACHLAHTFWAAGCA